ncbi:MBOAT family protein [Chroococcidiopsis sp. FACHB-1243]|uniref:MBOAT family O-acyltransferase n=1 Tax=Chroococcidiopsis sp. [FACHB-1243] TaxID=2692781 RepID=UPI00177F6BA3|nr:MBOAT family protein [Chroococcidiopsis sp. [FACHB-1243]]MBD2305778.1 MBOAT family protein [Chroococcidiopsis sp. [FACHB-1243]]
MLFTSPEFAFFFLVTFIIYYLPFFQKQQLIIIIAGSFIFYGWNSSWLTGLLALSISLNAIASFQIINLLNKRKKHLWMTLGIIGNLFILGFFKYGILITNFITSTFHISNVLTDSIISLISDLPVPIGLSFYTFLSIGLLVDLTREQSFVLRGSYSKKISFKHHLLSTSLFITFFPSLISGPISRASDFYAQIQPKFLKEIPWHDVLRSLIIGYYLKMVIADNLKDYTYWISFPYYQSLGTMTNIVLLVGYSIQIFADFAGYSLIAIGLAAALGYRLPQNFNFPYVSLSLSEFWRRWHISLSTWLRDYLYFPLGGNRKGKIRTYINLIVVMTLGGLWHGATWNYAVWGIFHGCGLALERLLSINKTSKQIQVRAKPFWQQFSLDFIHWFLVFSFVSIGWIFFKIVNFDAAIDFFITLTRNIHQSLSLDLIAPTILFSLPVVISHVFYFSTSKYFAIGKILRNVSLKTSMDLVLGILLALTLLDAGSTDTFIYFQF